MTTTTDATATTTATVAEILDLLTPDPWATAEELQDSADVPLCVSCGSPAALLVRTRLWDRGRTIERTETMCVTDANDQISAALHSGPQSHTTPMTVRIMGVLDTEDTADDDMGKR